MATCRGERGDCPKCAVSAAFQFAYHTKLMSKPELRRDEHGVLRARKARKKK